MIARAALARATPTLPIPPQVTLYEVLAKTDHVSYDEAHYAALRFGLHFRPTAGSTNIANDILSRETREQKLYVREATKIHVEHGVMSGITKASLDDSVIARNPNLKFDANGFSVDTPVILITYEGVHVPSHGPFGAGSSTITYIYDETTGDWLGSYSYTPASK
jgi:hypothetical protein